jgi:hypothetical protein
MDIQKAFWQNSEHTVNLAFPIAKINKEKQLQGLERFIDNMGKFQNIFKDDPRYELHPDKIAEAFGSLSDVKNANEFVTMKNGPSPAEQQLQQENEQLKQQMQQLQQERQMEQMDAKMGELQSAQEQASQPQRISNSTGLYSDPDIASLAESVAKM